jgi:acyl-CoA synthetase (NDP forming)
MSAERMEILAIESEVADILDELKRDPAASPVAVAVIDEFRQKARKAHGRAGVDRRVTRESLIEAAEAGVAAKVVIDADDRVPPTVRRALARASRRVQALRART